MKDKHWQAGRSAKKLAEYFISANGYMPKEISGILTSLNISDKNEFYGEPEAITNFSTKGEGRNHDLLITNRKDIVIGIEAKVDETLGNYVLKELLNYPSENKIERIKNFYNEIYGDKQYSAPNVRYQLLTATSGTLIEARKANLSKAVLLIITFIDSYNIDKMKIDNNIRDIEEYKNSLLSKEDGNKINVPGFADIDFYIEHIELKL